MMKEAKEKTERETRVMKGMKDKRKRKKNIQDSHQEKKRIYA